MQPFASAIDDLLLAMRKLRLQDLISSRAHRQTANGSRVPGLACMAVPCLALNYPHHISL